MVVRWVELEISISRLAHGDSLRELRPLRIEERLTKINRYIQEGGRRAVLAGEFVEEHARLASQLFHSGEEALAQSFFSALIDLAELARQGNQVLLFSAIGDELVELDSNLAENLYLRAFEALNLVIKEKKCLSLMVSRTSI